MFEWPQESSLRVKNLLDKSASIRFRQNQLQQRCYKNASAAAAEVGAAIARRMNERRLMCDNAKLQVGSPPCHVCAGTWPTVAHICAGTHLALIVNCS